jgi:hypothetical protein
MPDRLFGGDPLFAYPEFLIVKYPITGYNKLNLERILICIQKDETE